MKKFNINIKPVIFASGIAISALLYSIYKSDVGYMQTTYDSANSCYVAASTDSAHRMQFAKKGLRIIDGYWQDQRDINLASTGKLNKLEENLKKIVR